MIETKLPVIPNACEDHHSDWRETGNRNDCDTQPENDRFGSYCPAHSLRKGWISSILRAKSA